MKNLLFISEDKEKALIQEITYRIKKAQLDIHPSNTCFLCVSPDYSSIVTQHLSHSLTMNGEIFHIEAVNVPFPDESDEKYKINFENSYLNWIHDWEKFVLIEAGVIRGGNYTWITEIMQKISNKSNYYTVALCENIHSKFLSLIHI